MSRVVIFHSALVKGFITERHGQKPRLFLQTKFLSCCQVLNDSGLTKWAKLKKKYAHRNFPGFNAIFMSQNSMSVKYDCLIMLYKTIVKRATAPPFIYSLKRKTFYSIM